MTHPTPTEEAGMTALLSPVERILYAFEQGEMDAAGTIEDLVEHSQSQAEGIERLREALEVTTALVQNERDCLVECSTTPPDHDLATLDPLARPDVEEMDAALELARTTLAGDTKG